MTVASGCAGNAEPGLPKSTDKPDHMNRPAEELPRRTKGVQGITPEISADQEDEQFRGRWNRSEILTMVRAK